VVRAGAIVSTFRGPVEHLPGGSSESRFVLGQDMAQRKERIERHLQSCTARPLRFKNPIRTFLRSPVKQHAMRSATSTLAPNVASTLPTMFHRQGFSWRML